MGHGEANSGGVSVDVTEMRAIASGLGRAVAGIERHWQQTIAALGFDAGAAGPGHRGRGEAVDAGYRRLRRVLEAWSDEAAGAAELLGRTGDGDGYEVERQVADFGRIDTGGAGDLGVADPR